MSIPTAFFNVEADSLIAVLFLNKQLKSKERREADQGLVASTLTKFYSLILDTGVCAVSVLSESNQFGHDLCWLGNNKEDLIALFMF